MNIQLKLEGDYNLNSSNWEILSTGELSNTFHTHAVCFSFLFTPAIGGKEQVIKAGRKKLQIMLGTHMQQLIRVE